jgi:hypothetical protein
MLFTYSGYCLTSYSKARLLKLKVFTDSLEARLPEIRSFLLRMTLRLSSF